MYSQEQQPAKKDAGDKRSPAASVEPGHLLRGPMSPATIIALQRSVGNQAVNRMFDADAHAHGPGSGHDEGPAQVTASTQREMLDAAMASPSRPLPGDLRAKAESFYQTDFSAARVHYGPVAQRATAAMGAEAMTVGSHVFLPPAVEHRSDIVGHELGHVEENLRGVRESGTDNGAGVTITDPGQDSEVTAAANGAAFAAGAALAPSIALRRAAADPGQGGPAAAGSAPVQRASGRDKEKSARQIALDLDKEVKKKWPVAYGGGRQGNAPDEVRVRYARSMHDDRTTQTLSHQSFLVYDAIQGRREQRKRSDGVDEREVQGMLINNRLLFASNFNESMDHLRPLLTGGSTDPYGEIVATHQSDAGRRSGLPCPDAGEYVGRVNRADRKTQAALAEQRGGPEDGTVAALRERFGKPVALLDIDSPGLHALLTEKRFEGSIFFLQYSAESNLVHAEQKLLLALRKSGIKPEEVKGRHAVMGRYRGCLCCTAALAYYRNELGFATMDYDPNPGFYYWESLDNLRKHHEHVVRDPRFRTHMMDLASQLPSTPALSRTQPPADAYENHGPESRRDASQAARRNYRSPSLSDTEAYVDEQGRRKYHSVTRDLDIDATGKSTGTRVGKGSKNITSRLRAQRIITKDEDRKNIQNVWLNGTPAERAEWFKYWENERGASRRELIEIIQEVDQSKSLTAIESAVYRAVKDRTGHEARDGQAPRPEIVRQPEKGKGKTKDKKAPSAPAPKRMGESSSGWRELLAVMQSDADFYDGWSRREKVKNPTYMEPSRMSAALAQTVAALRSRYTVSSMASLLHIAERTLRRFLTNNFGEPAAAASETQSAEQPYAHQYAEYEDEDAVMEGGGYSYVPGQHGGGAGMSTGLEPGLGGLSLEPHGVGPAGEGSSTGASFSHPQITGYTLRSIQGQLLYIENQTGEPYFRDPQTGRMFPLNEPSDVEMG